MSRPASRLPAGGGRHAHRGARIEARLSLRWEASVTMPGMAAAEPVVLCSCLSAGLEGALAQARALVDQRLTAGMTILLRRSRAAAGGGRPAGPRPPAAGCGERR